MRTNKEMREEIVHVACELTRKFGFVSRSIVWTHLAGESLATKYRWWQFLSNRPEFAIYKMGLTSPNHLVLSNEYRKGLGDGAAVAMRPAIYFRHDEHLMDFVLHLKRASVISEFWTEQQLKMDRLLAINVLGGDPDAKIPDLVLDLKTESGPIRMAIEIERTRKSQKRYRLVNLGYSRLKKIQLLLFGVVDASTESAIRREFDRAVFTNENRTVGYFTLNEFSNSGLGASVRIRDRSPELGAFLKRVCGNSWSLRGNSQRKLRENSENLFSLKQAISKDAA